MVKRTRTRVFSRQRPKKTDLEERRVCPAPTLLGITVRTCSFEQKGEEEPKLRELTVLSLEETDSVHHVDPNAIKSAPVRKSVDLDDPKPNLQAKRALAMSKARRGGEEKETTPEDESAEGGRTFRGFRRLGDSFLRAQRWEKRIDVSGILYYRQIYFDRPFRNDSSML